MALIGSTEYPDIVSLFDSGTAAEYPGKGIVPEDYGEQNTPDGYLTRYLTAYDEHVGTIFSAQPKILTGYLLAPEMGNFYSYGLITISDYVDGAAQQGTEQGDAIIADALIPIGLSIEGARNLIFTLRYYVRWGLIRMKMATRYPLIHTGAVDGGQSYTYTPKALDYYEGKILSSPKADLVAQQDLLVICVAPCPQYVPVPLQVASVPGSISHSIASRNTHTHTGGYYNPHYDEYGVFSHYTMSNTDSNSSGPNKNEPDQVYSHSHDHTAHPHTHTDTDEENPLPYVGSITHHGNAENHVYFDAYVGTTYANYYDEDQIEPIEDNDDNKHFMHADYVDGHTHGTSPTGTYLYLGPATTNGDGTYHTHPILYSAYYTGDTLTPYGMSPTELASHRVINPYVGTSVWDGIRRYYDGAEEYFLDDKAAAITNLGNQHGGSKVVILKFDADNPDWDVYGLAPSGADLSMFDIRDVPTGGSIIAAMHDVLKDNTAYKVSVRLDPKIAFDEEPNSIIEIRAFLRSFCFYTSASSERLSNPTWGWQYRWLLSVKPPTDTPIDQYTVYIQE